MPSPTEITVAQLARLIGTPDSPALVNVCIDDDYNADPRFIPGSVRRSHKTVADWAVDYRGQRVVVICLRGQKLSQGTAAWLRHEAIAAETLEGGIEAWRAADQMLVKSDKLPSRDIQGRTHWVTRERPKIDRIACPWLIRRFVEPSAVILFGCRRPVRSDPVRHRRGCLESSWRGLHVRHHVGRVRPGLTAARAACWHRTGCRYGTPRPGAGGGGPSCHIARPVSHVQGRRLTTRGRDVDLRCLVSLVPRCDRRDAQLAHACQIWSLRE